MAKQTFTTGNVLTAAQMNSLQANDYNWTVSQKSASYILTAADVGTRIEMNTASNTSVTVNTGIFAAGDTLFIQNIGSGTCTITAGTATVNRASSASLALAQYQGGYLYFVSTSSAVFFADAGFASPLTTKGDLFTWDTGNQRLASSGVNNDVLTVDTTTATGLKWAAPSSGAMTSLFSGSLSGSAIDMNSISSGYKDLVLVVRDYYASLNFGLNVAINGTTITTMSSLYWGSQSPGGTVIGLTSGTGFAFNNAANTLNADAQNMAVAYFYDYTNTNSSKIISSYCQYKNASTSNLTMEQHLRTWQTTSAISRLYMTTDAGTFSGGSYILYGVK